MLTLFVIHWTTSIRSDDKQSAVWKMTVFLHMWWKTAIFYTAGCLSSLLTEATSVWQTESALHVPATVCQTLKGQKERVAPAVAGDVLNQIQIWECELHLLSLAAQCGPITSLESWAFFKTERWLVHGVISTECHRLRFGYSTERNRVRLVFSFIQ